MKPTVAFYLGYASLASQNYGSELALIKLVNQLRKWYSIYIISFTPPISLPGITFISPRDYLDMTFDCIVISRYINFYLHLPLRAPKVFIWLHDIGLQPFFNGISLPQGGRWILENVVCDGVIAQTHWHKGIFNMLYPSTADIESGSGEGRTPTFIIGNGIDTDRFAVELPKTPYKFIWTSSPKRGLSYLLKIFPKIKEKYPESNLYIYRGREEFTHEQFKAIEDSKEFIHYEGAVSNDVIAQEFLTSEVWLYPTDFNETYCISALEAQAAGCLCICTDIAALGEVVGERGILLRSPYQSEEYFQEIMTGLETLFTKREEYSQKARDWGMKQDWSNRADMWKTMLDLGEGDIQMGQAGLVVQEIPAPPNTPVLPIPECEINVVNLDRRPDRWDYVQSHLSEISLQRFSACDGQKLVLNDDIKRIFTNRGYPQKNPYPGHGWRKGVIGCAMSHYHLWEKASKLTYPLVVFEDDPIKCEDFLSRFSTVMNYLVRNDNWDLCFLGYLDDRPIYGDAEIASLPNVKIHQFNPVPARKHGGGTHGYVVSPKGAHKLLALVEKYGIPQPVDWFMIEMFGASVGGSSNPCDIESPLRALKCSPHLVEQLPGDTDIQRDFSQVKEPTKEN